MKQATFDPSRDLTLYFRCNRAGSKDFVFVRSNESAYSFIYTDDIELNIYKNQGDKKKLISLTYISGLTLNANRLTASITAALSNINEGEYYWELYRTDLEKTWLCGDAIFHNGKFDGVTNDSETITVNEDGEDILITVSDSQSAIIVTESYSTELTFNQDKEIYKDATGLSPVFTLGTTNYNGIGIILRLNTPTSVTFPVNFEAHANSAAVDPTKLNYFILLYHSNWNGTGTPRVIYTNSLFTAI